MDKPIQPPQDLIDLVKCGVIWSIEYDQELSEDARAEAESACHHEGRFEWDCLIHIKGRVAGKQLCHPDETQTTITESILEKYVEVRSDANRWGFWQVTHEGRVLVELWLKYLKHEAKDLREYDRLKKKFGRMG
jgi:hypothetical protein